ncbi:MAG: hypothetical protein KZQ88_00485 [Candidatus Thiodiazotropha sp. (ex Dulcina madagascariensis)]|nr:hypothetical protein [Candidatus Thiodiazotropha sp. (ex Dulcina madagascariensis)]MCU7927416.1 hypothetical protein [Candidatus Thiodiazotropha sp. (ex Dulcina madagascariensis)]
MATLLAEAWLNIARTFQHGVLFRKLRGISSMVVTWLGVVSGVCEFLLLGQTQLFLHEPWPFLRFDSDMFTIRDGLLAYRNAMTLSNTDTEGISWRDGMEVVF